MDVLPPGWEDLTAKAIVGLGVLMIFLGWLIPKRTHEREMRDKDAAIADRDETISFQRETIDRLTTATQNLAVPAHTAATALRHISKAAEAAQGGDE